MRIPCSARTCGSNDGLELVWVEDAQSGDGIAEDAAALVRGMEEPEKVLAESPFAGEHSRPEESHSVSRGVIELFKVVEDQEIRRRRFEELGRKALLERGGYQHELFYAFELIPLTSNRSRGFPTTSKRNPHRSTSVFRAQPTTTSSA